MKPAVLALQPRALPRGFTLLALAAAAAGLPAYAQTSPYYVGVSQALAYDSNLYREADNRPLPAGATQRSDTVSTTSLLAGLDQPIGRQRVYGTANLSANRFASNDSLNNQSYALNLGLDWQTINRISGTLSAGASRNLRRFDPNDDSNLQKNVETVNRVDADLRIGGVTRLTAEAGLNWREVGYTAAAYDGAEYHQTGGSLGVRYRPGGATVLGAGLRMSTTHYPRSGADRDRQDIDLMATWTPSGLTSVSGRLSYGRTDSSISTLNDFKGVTGELSGVWQATGKIRLNGRLLRDTGQDSAFLSSANAVLASSDYSRTTTMLQLGADYAWSAKVNFTSSVNVSRRDLNNSLFDLYTGVSNLSGSDTTTTLSLGARWAPTRAIQLGCSLVREQRSVSSNLSLPYSSNGVSCYGQFVIQ